MASADDNNKRDITGAAKDALYVTVGLGVIAFQRAQVRRQELKDRFAGTSKLLEGGVRTIEERLDGMEERLDAVLDQIEDRLPEQARDASRQARKAARDARNQVRSLVSSRNGK